MREELTVGDAHVGDCHHLSWDEHTNLQRAFNLGIVLTQSHESHGDAPVGLGVVVGEPNMIVDCAFWNQDFQSPAFGAALAHAMGHVAGYHDGGIEEALFWSECKAIGEPLCEGHCKEWLGACDNHTAPGGRACGVLGLGCEARCVRSEHCFSLPERASECLGFGKKHSRLTHAEDFQ
eukprot:SRR837773.6313.p1 GENE.SRR837773.6313~~SRR837773.6313.p1  ORF type:complete len:178 (-),score=41.66 SRR837773.6313:72-605(-)